MQVQAVNNQTLTPTLSQRARGKDVSFGAIYQPKNVKFNKIQEPIAEAIKKALREPLQKFKGEMAEGFYKSKGYDFGIEPYRNHSVYLTAYKGMEETGTGVNRKYSYMDYVRIGEYGRKSDFRISDIETGIKEKTAIDLGFIAVALTGIATFLAYGLLGSRISEQKMQEATKPLIENVDSVANKAKSVLPDTTAVNTKVLKVIKK